MSVPVNIALAAVALALGIPVIVAGTQLEARHRVAGAADAAALAAADAASGWIDADPCSLASEVAEAAGARVTSCRVDVADASARILTAAGVAWGGVKGRAHAGPVVPVSQGAEGAVGENGWAWPSDVRGITQGFHQGYSIDLAVTAEGALFAPFDGVVVRSGADHSGVPDVCRANPSWWRGTNQIVMMRHDTGDRVLYSSHNHVVPGSPARFGIREGTRVTAGQRVATSGMSGCTSGPHSHFTLASAPTNAASDVNPFDYLGSP